MLVAVAKVVLSLAACSGFGGSQEQSTQISFSLFQNLLVERCPLTLAAFMLGVLLASLCPPFYSRKVLSKCIL